MLNLIDSHCHLNYPQLLANLDDYLMQMQTNGIIKALCVATKIADMSNILALVNANDNLYASVGVHPDYEDEQKPYQHNGASQNDSQNGSQHEDINNLSTHDLLAQLLKFTSHNKVVALGETGLDYYHCTNDNIAAQKKRFAIHIEAAKQTGLPLIIHTRHAISDTIAMLKEANLGVEGGGVLHCFTENVTHAKTLLDLGFYISISGIVTFKNADIVKEVASYVPIDRLLIETDAPFLAPVPYRGKTNHPALLLHTATYIANLRQISLDALANATTNNFFSLFQKTREHNT